MLLLIIGFAMLWLNSSAFDRVNIIEAKTTINKRLPLDVANACGEWNDRLTDGEKRLSRCEIERLELKYRNSFVSENADDLSTKNSILVTQLTNFTSLYEVCSSNLRNEVEYSGHRVASLERELTLTLTELNSALKKLSLYRKLNATQSLFASSALLTQECRNDSAKFAPTDGIGCLHKDQFDPSVCIDFMSAWLVYSTSRAVSALNTYGPAISNFLSSAVSKLMIMQSYALSLAISVVQWMWGRVFYPLYNDYVCGWYVEIVHPIYNRYARDHVDGVLSRFLEWYRAHMMEYVELYLQPVIDEILKQINFAAYFIYNYYDDYEALWIRLQIAALSKTHIVVTLMRSLLSPFGLSSNDSMSFDALSTAFVSVTYLFSAWAALWAVRSVTLFFLRILYHVLLSKKRKISVTKSTTIPASARALPFYERKRKLLIYSRSQFS